KPDAIAVGILQQTRRNVPQCAPQTELSIPRAWSGVALNLLEELPGHDTTAPGELAQKSRPTVEGNARFAQFRPDALENINPLRLVQNEERGPRHQDALAGWRERELEDAAQSQVK